MIDTLKNVTDSLLVANHQTVKDTIYLVSHSDRFNTFQFITIFITVAALIFSAISVWISYTHKKLSVRPLLSFNEDFSFNNNGLGILLKNNGLGPAIIKDFKMFWDNSEITEEIRNIIYDTLKIHRINLGNFTEDAIIGKDSSHWVFRIPKTELSPERAEEVYDIIKDKLKMKTVYHSMYFNKDIELTTKYPFIIE